MPTAFEWNERKDRTNRKKHGFAEAALVFADPLARIFPDEEHSIHEHREIIIGNSPANRLGNLVHGIGHRCRPHHQRSEGDQERATGL